MTETKEPEIRYSYQRQVHKLETERNAYRRALKFIANRETQTLEGDRKVAADVLARFEKKEVKED